LHEGLDAHSCIGVRIEELEYDVAGGFRKPIWEIILSAVDFLVHGYEVIIVEWKITCEEYEEDNTAGPSVGFGPVVAAPTDDFGSCVSRRAASRVKQAVFELLGESREAEVRDFEVSVFVQEEVLWLHVAVSHAVSVAEAESRDQLVEVTARGLFCQFASARDFGEKLASRGEFDHEIDLGFRRHDFVDFKNVWVVVEFPHG
jgi:hypothetical protein